MQGHESQRVPPQFPGQIRTHLCLSLFEAGGELRHKQILAVKSAQSHCANLRVRPPSNIATMQWKLQMQKRQRQRQRQL